MTPDAVAAYLKDHPEFFEQYAEFLSTFYIPHPHGGRAISIGERQILTLREKGKQLEAKLRELIQYGEENDAIGEKLHRLTLALIGARGLSGVIGVLGYHLGEDFAVPHVALRLWHQAADPGLPECAAVGEDVKQFAESLTVAYCAAHAMLDTVNWFGAAGAELKSFAYVPLRGENAFGLLVLASEDAGRFYPEMGTLYLKRLGELAAASFTKSFGAP